MIGMSMLVFEEIVNYLHWISLISMILAELVRMMGMIISVFEEIVNYFQRISLIS